MTNYDAIVTLGAGVNADGSLELIGKERVNTAINLFKRKISKRIIMSGKYWGGLTFKPLITEAEAMKRYAIENEVPRYSIIKEEKSMDTVGNAFFTKRILEYRKWNKIVVVTSDFHLARTRFIFNFIMGKGYKISFMKSLSNISKETLEKIKIGEKEYLNFVKLLSRNINPGDDENIKRIIFNYHPFYSPNKVLCLLELSEEELAEELEVSIHAARKYTNIISKFLKH